MDFNPNHPQHQYAHSNNMLVAQQQNRGVPQMMYPVGNYMAQQQVPHPGMRMQQQPYAMWSSLNAAAKTYPIQRRNTLGADLGRPQLADQPPSSGPMPVTAQTLRTLAEQNPSVIADFPTTMGQNAWDQQKTCNDLDFANEMSELGQGLLSVDEDGPIIDLRQYPGFDQDHSHRASMSRRVSESSFSMSSTGPLAEVPTIEDYSTSELAFIAENEWPALESTPQPQLMSPITSPRSSYQEMRRAGSRSRSSPAPHSSVRSSPYTMDSNRAKRWSTGGCNPMTPPQHQLNRFKRFSTYGSPLNPHVAFSPIPTEYAPSPQIAASSYMYATPTIPSSTPQLYSAEHAFPDAPRALPSQGLFRLLQSNADRMAGCASHFADLSEPPDLYSSLHEEPCNPPESDMNPSDPDMIPHEQDLRFTGDMYTPRWVRGHGNKREGWCGLCKPGRWLVLKNSAFWYDKSFTHGVSAATGVAFQGPQDTRRTEGNLDVWEGLCGSCGEWIPLVSSKKKGTTWFRHAYKCHTHPKVKDGAKRRRETSSILRARPHSMSASYPTSASAPPAAQALAATPLLNDGIKLEKAFEPSSAPPSTMQTPRPKQESLDESPVSGQHTTEVHHPQPSQAHQISAAKLEGNSSVHGSPEQQGRPVFETAQPPPQTPQLQEQALATDHPHQHQQQQQQLLQPFPMAPLDMLHDDHHYGAHPGMEHLGGMSMHEDAHSLFSSAGGFMHGLNIFHTHDHQVDDTINPMDSFNNLL